MVALPLVTARAQVAKLRTVGFLGIQTRANQEKWTTAFVQRLRELDWIEGRTVLIEYRWAEGSGDRMSEIAAEFVRLKVDVILTAGTAATLAAKQATSVIPVVFTTVADPVGTGVVGSLSRPEGNITGLSNQSAEIAGKRVALLGEIVPNLRRLAILASASSPIGVMETRETQLAAQTVGIDTVALAIRRAEEIAPAIEGIKGRADALYIASEALMNTNRFRINGLALDARLPTMHGEKGYVEAGGLMSYGASFTDMYRRAAEYVDKILRGAKAADLPVAQPTKFELAINAKIAKALGLAVTDKLISLADEVVE
ncbi:ABC transporter substrate-binding protein [Bradyrhizobium sp. OAE829]|uniref:ABC transporter substrate-binding protein n=1 Tax=Bradyrhizobium sp. OAE829 TaxID=2663807 RepID=UPI00178A12C4